ncbi:MAG: alkaline phosphatase family protein [Novosphingobium sp.]|nr:alkaline phosphatase family protein [Novosphingobium sp.]MCP5404294.1 alkaline phosphatase family protein [Novosphingobium sp.]
MRAKCPITAFAAAMTLAAAAPVCAEETEPAAAPEAAEAGPSLVLAISVDQFSADLFAQYRRNFTDGLARLQQGAVFPSGYQAHAATETCPGHSTLMTGVHPARSGIVANHWFDPEIAREDKSVYCAEDETDPASNSHDPVVSAAHLKVPTLGDRMKAENPKSRNVSVSGKDRAAIMMGGHDLDAVYWWKGSGFTSLAGRKLSPAAQAQNREVAQLIETGAGTLEVPEWCAPRDRAVPVGDFTIGTGRFSLPADTPNAFRISPRFDAATVDLAVRLIDEQKLGRDTVPDVLSVSLSATDYIGHAYGHEGVEMCIQMAQLDKSVGRLFAELDKRGIDYVAVLTADHGGIDAPERLEEQGYPQAGRAGADLSTKALGEEITRRTGIAAPTGPLLLGGGGSGDLYISAGLSPADKARVSAELVSLLEAHPQVAAVFPSGELAEAPLPSGSPQEWSLRDRARANFDPERSGDLTVLLKRGIVPVDPGRGYVSTHGSPWDYDRRVPMLFWRKGLAGLEQPAPVETIDIAPTLAALVGLEVPEEEFDGRCLDIDGGAANICRQ